MAFKTKEASAKYHREVWYPKNKQRRIELNRAWRAKIKQEFSEYKSTLKCQLCPESESICLDFHHIDPTKKDRSVGEMFRYGPSMKQLMDEVDKCVVLCANCHRKVHAGIAQLAEQPPCKGKVESSILSSGTNLPLKQR
jgi:hypothetical protein